MRFLVVALLASAVCAIEVFHVEGDHFSIGQQIGARFQREIAQHLNTDPSLARIMSFVQTKSGSSAFRAFSDSVESFYPQYVSEIRGMAEGAGLPFENVLAANMMAEMGNLVQEKGITDCSDVMLKDDTHAIIAHNEDNVNSTLKSSFIVRATIHSNSSGSTSYTSFHYPGQIAGDSFGFNEHGLVFSTNALFPKQVRVGGVPRVFLGRDLFNARSIDELIARVNTPHLRASGFSINVGSIHDGRIFNLELSPEDFVVREVKGAYAHFNQYLRMITPHVEEPSSDHRLQRYEQLGAPSDLASMLRILGDAEDKQYPIYRDGSPPDTEIVTIATAVFDLRARTLSVFDSNPKLAAGPVLVLDIGRDH